MRAKHSLSTTRLKVTINHVLAEHLDLAVQTGLFGPNRMQCAERLIGEGLRRLVKEGIINPIETHHEEQT